MRKTKTSLIPLFLFLVFNACQKNDEIVSPNTNSGQNQTLEKITVTEINLNSPSANTCIQLVAGRNLVVGDVCVDYIENTHKLKVTYSITEPGWTITKTQVAAVIHPFFFPRTWTLQPLLSHFPYKETHDHVTSVEYMIDIPYYYDNVYLAIHAKAEGITSSGEPVLEPILPASDVMIPTWMPSGSDYIVETDFNNLGVYQSWNIDNSRFLSSGERRDIKYISSYSDEIPECISFIENNDNLDLVNWIINNKEPNWDKMTIQAAISTLLNQFGFLSNLNDPNDPRYWEMTLC